MKLDHFLTPHTKTNSKWIKDLNVRQEIIKILPEKTDSNLFDLGHSNFLHDMSLEARGIKASCVIGKPAGHIMDYHKLCQLVIIYASLPLNNL